MVLPFLMFRRTDLDAQLCGVEDSCDEHGLPVRRIANYSEGRTASSTAASSTTERGGSGARDGGDGSGSTKKVHLLPGPLGSGAYGSVHKGTWQVGMLYPRSYTTEFSSSAGRPLACVRVPGNTLLQQQPRMAAWGLPVAPQRPRWAAPCS